MIGIVVNDIITCVACTHAVHVCIIVVNRR